eukprot:m.80602 g.80602  ORF g.80602 m.80602 type:complete len:306 (-) comp14667_c0_seq8:96-1013(-)
MTLAEKTQQKAAYCLGVGALMLATAGLSAAPHRFHFIYAIIITPLLFLRFHQYLSTKREYYLYDLCYGVNGLAVLAMAWPTRNVWMYQTVFVLGNGPMCAAIIIWHNMIVFHSADRLGSFSLHFLVTLLAFTWRWYPAEGQRSVLCSDDTCSLSLWNWLCAPVLFYLAWTSMYLMKTEVLDKQRLAADPELHTSLRWWASHQTNASGLVRRMFRSLGIMKKGEGFHSDELKTKVMYQSCLLGITVVTALPAKLLFSNFWLHSAWMAVAFAAALWRGADFYFERFQLKAQDMCGSAPPIATSAKKK